MSASEGSRSRVLVTGATGFVGSALAARLVRDGCSVVALARRAPATAVGMEWRQGDLEDQESLVRATRGVDTVFHVGGAVGHFGHRPTYLRVNVGGARNLVHACVASGVGSLVFTSTPSVIADGVDHFDVDESHPYSQRFESPYSESKALAEQVIRSASSKTLRTVCLRPHLIWGPGKDHWVTGFRKLAARNLLVQIGAGRNRVGLTYLDDCIDAHLAAWRAVRADAAVSGRAFFVNSGEPILLWQWVRQLVAALGLPGVRATVPTPAARMAAALCDALVMLSRGALHFRISRYLITELTTEHYSRIDAARKWLGFQPTVSVPEGLSRLAAADRIARSSTDAATMASATR